MGDHPGTLPVPRKHCTSKLGCKHAAHLQPLYTAFRACTVMAERKVTGREILDLVLATHGASPDSELAKARLEEHLASNITATIIDSKGLANSADLIFHSGGDEGKTRCEESHKLRWGVEGEMVKGGGSFLSIDSQP